MSRPLSQTSCDADSPCSPGPNSTSLINEDNHADEDRMLLPYQRQKQGPPKSQPSVPKSVGRPPCPLTFNVIRSFNKMTYVPISNESKPYLQVPELRNRFNFDIVDLDWTTGAAPSGRLQYTRPISYNTMRDWIKESHCYDVNDCRANFVMNPNEKTINSNLHEADRLFSTIEYYLTTSRGLGLDSNIMDNHTNWQVFDHYYDVLKESRHPSWKAQFNIRVCKRTRGGQRTQDPRFPHQVTFVSGQHKLRNDALVKGEVCAILIFASFYAANTLALKGLPHQVVPITVVSASWRSARIVQGIVDYRKFPPSVELRKGPIYDFEKGVKHPECWRGFVTLLGWIVGQPIQPEDR